MSETRVVVTVSVTVAVVDDDDVDGPVEPFICGRFGGSIRIVILGVIFAVTFMVAFIPSTRGTEPRKKHDDEI